MVDDDLDAYLDGDSELSSLYHQTAKTAPATPAVDDAVRAAAQEASPPAKVTPLRRARRWWVPTSVAATLVLGTSLYLFQQPAQMPLLDAVPMAPAERQLKEATEEAAPVLRKMAPAPPSALDSTAPAATEQRRAKAVEQLAAPVEADALRARQRPDASADFGADPSTESSADARTAPATAARMEMAVPRGQSAVSEAEQGSPAPTPDAWLRQIEQQLNAGDWETARAALTAFRARYPDHPIPQPLLSRLTASPAKSSP